MAVFRFKLESILSIKEKIEDQKKIELGNAMIALQAQRDVLDDLKRSHHETVCVFNEKNGKKILARELVELSVAIKYYEEAIIGQKEVILRYEVVVEEKRVALNSALMERKTYEKLKEIAFENYLKEEQSDAFKQLDEIISYKYSN